MIVDMHSHFVPMAAVRGSDSPIPMGEEPDGSLYLILGGHRHGLSRELVDLDLQRETMRAQGLDRKVLAVPPFCFQYELPDAEGARWSRLLNDGIAQAVRTAPEAFRGFATLPLQDIPAALAEFDRAIDDLGLAGIEIATNIASVELDDSRLDPFWERAAARGLPILIHPHYVAGASRMQEYHLRNLVGNPLDTTLAGSRLLFGGVLERFPGLKIILSHGGGALPHIIGRLAQGYRVRPECRAHASAPEAIVNALFFDTIVFDAMTLRHLVEVVGASQIILGTDFPFDMSEGDPVSFVRGAGLGQDEADAIIANGERLLAGHASVSG